MRKQKLLHVLVLSHEFLLGLGGVSLGTLDPLNVAPQSEPIGHVPSPLSWRFGEVAKSAILANLARRNA